MERLHIPAGGVSLLQRLIVTGEHQIVDAGKPKLKAEYAPSMVFSNALAFSPRLLPNTYRATKTEISKAIGVEPIIRANCTQPRLR